MRDPEVFGSWFSPWESWSPWATWVKAVFGLRLEDDELALFRECTGRDVLPSEPAREAWVIVGRRGGKSAIAAFIAVALACFKDYSHVLKPGERATIMVLAADRKQARVLMRYIAGFLEPVPMLRRMIERKTEEAIDLDNGVTIEVHTASFRSVRGYTLAGVVADEVAFWRDDSSANPDTEILAALRPGMATIPDALLVAISSPYARRGALWTAYDRHHGRNGDPVFVWKAPSRTMNPTLSQGFVDNAYAEDEASAAAEYGAEFRRDIEAYVSREALDAATVPGRIELPPLRGVSYEAFVDPSGGASDSMTLAIAHRERGRAILDLLREVRAPFSPESAVESFAAELDRYRIRYVTGDRYGAAWVEDAFRRASIFYRASERTKSEIYSELLSVLNSGRASLLDDQRLRQQLLGLERRTSRGGRDSIDHAPRAHDDVANAAAGAIVLAAEGERSTVEILVDVGGRDEIHNGNGLVAYKGSQGRWRKPGGAFVNAEDEEAQGPGLEGDDWIDWHYDSRRAVRDGGPALDFEAWMSERRAKTHALAERRRADPAGLKF